MGEARDSAAMETIPVQQEFPLTFQPLNPILKIIKPGCESAFAGFGDCTETTPLRSWL